MRDYLLEPEAGNADAHKASLDKDRAEMEAALAAYARRLSPGEVEPYRVLTGELQDYWRVLEPALRWDAAERRTRSYAFLRDEVLPRRMAMLSIADQIARVNERQLNDDNLQVAALFSQFRFRLTGTVIATLGLGTASGRPEHGPNSASRKGFRPGGRRTEGALGAPGAGAGERAPRHLARAAR